MSRRQVRAEQRRTARPALLRAAAVELRNGGTVTLTETGARALAALLDAVPLDSFRGESAAITLAETLVLDDADLDYDGACGNEHCWEPGLGCDGSGPLCAPKVRRRGVRTWLPGR